MQVYITDNPNINKTLQGDHFLSYQLYDWRVKEEIEGDTQTLINIIIKRRVKKKIVLQTIKKNDDVIAIVAPSNYKLIYDLLYVRDTFGKDVKFYSWEDWEKRVPLKIDEYQINNMFKKYLQRGVLTLKMFHELAWYNFPRIEQFSSLLLINSLNLAISTSLNLGLSSTYQETISKKTNVISLKGIIRCLVKDRGFEKAIDKLTYHHRNNDITDPFLGDFMFLNKNNSLFKFFEKNKNSDTYLGIDNGKLSKENIGGISEIIRVLEGFLPLVDVLKTLRYMETSGSITTDPNKVGFIPMINIKLHNLKYYFPYYNVSNWNIIYDVTDYDFKGLLPPIKENMSLFKCPNCSSNEFRETPTNFLCANKRCGFKICRIIKPGGVKKILTELEFLKLIHHGSTHVKNLVGGYSKYSLFQKSKNKFMVVPQIKKNQAEE